MPPSTTLRRVTVVPAETTTGEDEGGASGLARTTSAGARTRAREHVVPKPPVVGSNVLGMQMEAAAVTTTTTTTTAPAPAADGTDEEEDEDGEDEELSALARVSAVLMKKWYLTCGVALAGTSAWLRASETGGDDAWKYTGLCAGALCGRAIARGTVVCIVFVLENVLPLDQVAYYFDVLSPALAQLLWFVGVAVMWSQFFSPEKVGRSTHATVVKVLIVFALFLVARCLALLTVKVLTARLHAGTFWDQLKTTVKHEVMFRNLTGAPIRPRPTHGSRRSAMKRSSSFSRLKSHHELMKRSVKPRDDGSHERASSYSESGLQSDSGPARADDGAAHDPNHTPQNENDSSLSEEKEKENEWEEESNANNIRLATEQAEALIQNVSKPTHSVDSKSYSSYFPTLSVFKGHKAAANMSRFGQTERILDRAKMTLGTEVFDPETNAEMRKTARLIFTHIRRPGEKFITKEAIKDFLPPSELNAALDLLSGVDNFEFAAIGFQDLCRGIRKMFDERYLLAKTLQSMQGLAETLGRSLQLLFFIVVVIIGLFMFEVDVGSLWLLFSSSVLALTFIFGSSASRAFEAAVMIFAVHPFNIGDWIAINGVNYKVMELGIHATTLQDLVNEVMYVPTSWIAAQPIVNLTRSGELWMKVGVLLDMGITPAQCDQLKSVVSSFMSSDKRNFGSHCVVALRSVQERLKVELDVIYTLAFNGSQRLMMIEAHSRMVHLVSSTLLNMGVAFTGTDGMIFAHNPMSLDEALDASNRSPAVGVPVPTQPPPSTASTVTQNLSNNQPSGRLTPTTSVWRSQAMNERYAMQSNLRHLSGMLKMD